MSVIYNEYPAVTAASIDGLRASIKQTGITRCWACYCLRAARDGHVVGYEPRSADESMLFVWVCCACVNDKTALDRARIAAATLARDTVEQRRALP